MTRYIVEIKLAEVGTEYTYQKDKGKHKKGERERSKGGHAWLSIQKGSNEVESFGFTSELGSPFGAGNTVADDNQAYAYANTSIKFEISQQQYEQFQRFKQSGEYAGGRFDFSRYDVDSHNCVSAVSAALIAMGINKEKNLISPKFTPLSTNTSLVAPLSGTIKAGIAFSDLSFHLGKSISKAPGYVDDDFLNILIKNKGLS